MDSHVKGVCMQKEEMVSLRRSSIESKKRRSEKMTVSWQGVSALLYFLTLLLFTSHLVLAFESMLQTFRIWNCVLFFYSLFSI